MEMCSWMVENPMVQSDSPIDTLFSLAKLKRALVKTGQTTPGKDQVSYTMLAHLRRDALGRVLELINKPWLKLASSWKEATILPIEKPGKDPPKPTN